MTQRTIVKSIEGSPSNPTAYLVSCGMGKITGEAEVANVLSINHLPGIRQGDILRCNGQPYMSKSGLVQSNRYQTLKTQSLFDDYKIIEPKYEPVQIGEQAWALRKL